MRFIANANVRVDASFDIISRRATRGTIFLATASTFLRDLLNRRWKWLLPPSLPPVRISHERHLWSARCGETRACKCKLRVCTRKSGSVGDATGKTTFCTRSRRSQREIIRNSRPYSTRRANICIWMTTREGVKIDFSLSTSYFRFMRSFKNIPRQHARNRVHPAVNIYLSYILYLQHLQFSALLFIVVLRCSQIKRHSRISRAHVTLPRFIWGNRHCFRIISILIFHITLLSRARLYFFNGISNESRCQRGYITASKNTCAFYLDKPRMRDAVAGNIHLSVKRWKTLGRDCVRHFDISILEIEMEISLMSQRA